MIVVKLFRLPFFLVIRIPFKTVPEIESDDVEIKTVFPYGYPFSAYTA